MPGLLSASGMSKRIRGTGIFSRLRASPEAALVETSSEMAGLAWHDFPLSMDAHVHCSGGIADVHTQ
jgi:hypothetical protein